MRNGLLLLIVILFGACTNSGLPKSGGRAYGVLITGSDEAANEALATQLRELTMEGLPQEEPILDVSTFTSNGVTQGTRFARNLVVVTKSDTTSVRYERNAFADPQLLISVSTTGDIEKKYVQEIADLIIRQELKNGIGQLRRQHNRLAEEKAKTLLGYRLWVPEDLAKMKEGRDFLWLSNDAARGMQNICIFRYYSKELSADLVRQQTDSILQVNIPGEREGTWMQMVSHKAHQEDALLCMRGLWEVKGDAMGGPYVSLSTLQGDSIITALAFVYAPEQRKRNIIRRLEAALYTMKKEY